MSTVKIGKLTEVDVRDLWKHEQYDFSNWLAKEENIKLLDDEIGLTLMDINKEVYIGSYRCDLIAKDETTGQIVIIENQLEATNHDHLGKIITYAAGLDAKTIIWIVKEAREEHKAAIEWLNNNSSEEIGFFLIELHAYKINDSLPAPMFKVVEKPNNFTKTSKQNYSDKELNRSQNERLMFWEEFNTVIVAKGKPFSVRKPTTDHWYDVAIGTSEAHLAINLVNKENKIVLELYILDNKKLFDHLYEDKEKIENTLQMNFSWERLDGKKASRIKHDVLGLDFSDHSNYPQLMDECIEKILKMRDVFKKYL
ncbi:DUF4268 domain-containing protein [Holdemanella biformis]|uniref:DUF4268 domain-containing protein n=1 Tax=Holdemanella biformis TaxID=1735 RepID=A0A413UAH6_9FIRM|nr:DUF4268 domain-containing protein [Holdemanella biformis]RHB01697.1 DUF4268 domain-containing protein [Holdemanella biformis]